MTARGRFLRGSMELTGDPSQRGGGSMWNRGCSAEGGSLVLRVKVGR